MRTRGRDLQGKAENTGVPAAAKAAMVMRPGPPAVRPY